MPFSFKKRIKCVKILWLIFFLALLFLPIGNLFPKQKYDCFVTKVINENTFECDLEIDDFFKLYSKETIRIAHIERIRSKKIETITIQSIIEDILLGQMVTLVNLEQSKYGLIISDVYLDDILISQLFVKNDFVKVRKKDKSEIANKLRGKELK